MSLTVHTAATRDAGGCNACAVSAAHPEVVRVIHLRKGEHGGATEFRLCPPCADELRTLLGRNR